MNPLQLWFSTLYFYWLYREQRVPAPQRSARGGGRIHSITGPAGRYAIEHHVCPRALQTVVAVVLAPRYETRL